MYNAGERSKQTFSFEWERKRCFACYPALYLIIAVQKGIRVKSECINEIKFYIYVILWGWGWRRVGSKPRLGWIRSTKIKLKLTLWIVLLVFNYLIKINKPVQLNSLSVIMFPLKFIITFFWSYIILFPIFMQVRSKKTEKWRCFLNLEIKYLSPELHSAQKYWRTPSLVLVHMKWAVGTA